MTRSRFFIRDDRETEIDVDYEIRGGFSPSGQFGPPEDYDPGSPPEVTIVNAWLLGDANDKNAPSVTLTDAEAERFEEEVISDPDTWEPDDDYDY